MTEPFWVTREGEKLAVADMDDGHVRNALPFAERAARIELRRIALAALSYADNAPDGAADCATREGEHMLDIADMPLDQLIEEVRGEEHPLFEALIAMHERVVA